MSGEPLLVCLFHLNLAYSSLAEEGRSEVVQRCYRPLLALARESGFPIGIEASGWTLERIADHDPSWLAEARGLIEAGRVELVGSGYAQVAGPLVPACVNRWNLRLGLDAYERLLGARPRLALLSEQAYSPGLVDVYVGAGFEGIIADWDNAWRSHPQWPSDLRHRPQRARGVEEEIPVVWSESIAFQKFQRYAHAEMTREEYVRFVASAVDATGGALMLYANDAEVFDHRPGRFAAEPEIQEREWERIGEILGALITTGAGTPALPSDVLALLDEPGSGQSLSLEAPEDPVPVKKQDKYNISRWAVTGRDDIDINTRCGRLYARLKEQRIEDPEAWRELCTLWASDFRTHIVESRWRAAQQRLAAAEARWQVPAPPATRARRSVAAPGSLPDGVSRDGRRIIVGAGELEVALSTRRGLAIALFADRSVSPHALCGTIEHGYFETISLGADWYTADLVQEAPLRHKVTDLEPVEATFDRDGERIIVAGVVDGELGPIEKVVTIDPEARSVEVDWTLRWSELPPGSLRFGHLTLLPEAFDPARLFYATHNGGARLERHELGDLAVDHGKPVSALVSARGGLGITEGLLLLGDHRRHMRVEIDQEVARPLGLIEYHPAPSRFFLQASFSLTESDETRRGAIPRPPDRPQRARLRYSAHGD
jgi:Glycosyl hydrolase family 57